MQMMCCPLCFPSPPICYLLMFHRCRHCPQTLKVLCQLITHSIVVLACRVYKYYPCRQRVECWPQNQVYCLMSMRHTPTKIRHQKIEYSTEYLMNRHQPTVRCCPLIEPKHSVDQADWSCRYRHYRQ